MHHSLKKRPKISHKTRGALLQELAQTTSKSGSGWLVVDGWGQHAAIPHPYLLTPQRPRDMPTGWYDCYERWYQAEAQPPPLIQLEHFVHCELCVGPKISTGRRKKGAFYAELWVPVAVARIFNRIGPNLAVKRMDNSTNSASMFKQAKSKTGKEKNNFRLKV